MNRHGTIALLLTVLLLPACGQGAPPEPQTIRVENADLGIAIAALPAAFELVSAEGDTIELTAAGAGGPGRLVIAAGTVQQSGINLIEATRERRAWYEEKPGATYHGNRELGTPIGAAFTARATYPTEGGDVEETWVSAVHPRENRLLTVTYTYPTGETQVRIDQLLELLGEIEGVGGG